MKKILKNLIILSVLLTFLVLPYLVFAQGSRSMSPQEALKSIGSDSGFAEADEFTVSEIAGTVVNVALGLLGVFFIILIIYAGARWMGAQGNEQEVEAAQKIIKNSIIGLVIVVSSVAIYNLVSKIVL